MEAAPVSDARSAVLAGIRRALNRRGPLDASLANALEARLAARHVHVQPAFEEPLAERLRRKLEAVHASTEQIVAAQDIPHALARYCAQHDLPSRAVAGADAPLAGLAWPDTWQIETRPAGRDDALAVSVALAGIAETGTLMLVSSPASPVSHNYLPDDHVVVLPASRVVRHLEDAWTVLRTGAGMPRAVCLITGPSKTADVEQTLQYGAHGPRRLHLIVIDDA